MAPPSLVSVLLAQTYSSAGLLGGAEDSLRAAGIATERRFDYRTGRHYLSAITLDDVARHAVEGKRRDD